ncbi:MULTISPECIES: hypothetical protein [Pseudomonas]|uniref:Uncharacterized protein n=1 Tax=Pseudomonas protegens TaxID=380021 RepID=A0A2T6GRY7_9PSED|nr:MULTISPECIES: hypothetical protein [Pseudomonas]PUA46929.1 hypothetical protein C5U62_02825 [Pseudomonas protegens]RXU59815.1 hypothetical protein CW358_29660 [Pseudomonas protegens]ULT68196.1 hypothetical protein L1O02_17420 [Pseudomonas sp. BC42]BAQ74376.1 uncharacterized protein POS17_2682 [Pseudomonas sp. Os17]BAQ80682.1 uncharacterized protein PST29_2793 [Pseudomonas sp. St29]
MTSSLQPDASRDAQREQVITQLQQVIQRVPEQSEFTNTRRYQVLGPLFTLISLAMLAWGIHQGKTGMLLCGLFLTALFALVTWQHRHAGQHAFMRLTRRQLFVDSLSAPVNLTDVVDVHVKDEGLLTLQQLTLRPGCPLPTHRPVRQVFGNQAMAFHSPEPHIRIHSAGLMSAGRKLAIDDIAALLDAYCQAANAQQQLDELQGRG